MNRTISSIVLALCLTAPVWAATGSQPVAATPSAGATQAQGQVAFMTGGVGVLERDAMSQQAQRFNLKIVTAVSDGAYLGDGNVTIQDRKGNTLLQTGLDGPWLLAALPPGRYRVSVSALGVEKHQNVTVSGQGQQVARFYWNVGPVDGSRPR